MVKYGQPLLWFREHADVLARMRLSVSTRSTSDYGPILSTSFYRAMPARQSREWVDGSNGSRKSDGSHGSWVTRC